MSAATAFSCKTKRAQWLIAHIGDEKSVITDLRVIIFATNNNLFERIGQ
jgi:transcriptional regulator with GAF, ATPase, and Fis domain